MDLPAFSAQDVFAGQLAALVLRHGTAAAIFSYSSSGLGRQILRSALKALLRKGIRVIDAIAVRGSEASFLPGPDGRTEPSITVPADSHPVAAALSAAGAFAGRAVLDSRAALAASIAGPADGIPASVARHRVAAAEQRLGEFHRGRGSLGQRKIRGGIEDQLRAEQLLQQCVASFLDRHAVAPNLAADLAVAADDDVSVRDHLLGLVISDRKTEWTPVLSSCLHSVNAADAVALCTLLGAAAYRDGEGALAGICFDKALNHRPGYRLAMLLQRMLCHAVAPDELDGLNHPHDPEVAQERSRLRSKRP